MASASGTFTAAQQMSDRLLLRVGEAVRIILTPSAGTFTATLNATQEQPQSYTPLVKWTQTEAGYTYYNRTDQIQWLALKCEAVSGGTVAYTLADIAGDQVLEEWRAADGTLAFRITDRGASVGAGPAQASPATGDATTDTANLQAIAALGGSFVVPDGDYTLNGTITLEGDQTVFLSAGVTITQTATSTNIFRATAKDNVWVIANGAVLVGEGTWSDAWTGFSGHEDRALQFINCTNSGFRDLRARDFGSAAIAIIGGTGIRGNARIEGTHAYSTPLAAEDNFQAGVYILHGSTYGAADDIDLDVNVSGVAQGVLIEKEAGVATDDTGVRIVGHLHDIPGQHGIYCQAGKLTCDVVVDSTGLSGVKIQSNASNTLDLRGFNLRINATRTGSQALELAVPSPGTGFITGVLAHVVADECQRGVTIDGGVRNAQIHVVATDTTQYAALVDGANNENIDLWVTSDTSGRDGVLITATDSTGIRVRATVLNPGGETVNTFDGVNIQTASAEVDLIDLDIRDDRWVASPDDARMMRYGVFNETAGSTVRVLGSLRATGALTNAVRSADALLAFPVNATLTAGALDAALADINDLNAFFDFGALIRSGNQVQYHVQTTTGSAATAWYLALSDESAYSVTAEIVGKLAGGAERACFTSNVLAYRDGGTATIEGTADTIATTASASFAGVVAWDVSGNNLRLRLHSGSAVTYDWKLRITVTSLVD